MGDEATAKNKQTKGARMTVISTAIQRGGTIYLYDEKGQQQTILNAGGKPGDGLHGYTSTTVAVKRGGQIYVYDPRGCLKSIHNA